MSLVLLDTTFLIDAERDAPHLEAAIDDEDDVAIAAISLAELLVGVELATTSYRPHLAIWRFDRDWESGAALLAGMGRPAVDGAAPKPGFT